MHISVMKEDITKIKADAIVNAANPLLIKGGGVDGCIHRAAGPELQKECFKLHGCMFGKAKITNGWNLPCKYVIHTVGPVWLGGFLGERKLLRACYLNSLALAEKYGCHSVAFPLISTGIFGYPKKKAIKVAVDAICEYTAEKNIEVYIAVIDDDIYKMVNDILDSKQ